MRQIDPLPRNARRFQKERDAIIDELVAAGKVPSDASIAPALGVSTTNAGWLCPAVLCEQCDERDGEEYRKEHRQ
jgi:hypothetical protein